MTGWPLTFNGNTYTEAMFAGNGYADALPKLLRDVASHAAQLYQSPSATSLEVADAGDVALTVAANKTFARGQPIRIARSSDPANVWMTGPCLDYVTATGALSVRRTDAGGSGTYADWTVSVDGGSGPEGPVGPIGPTPAISTSTSATLPIQLGATASFACAADVPLLVGTFVLMTASGDPNTWMFGQIATKAGATLTVDVQGVNGSGSPAGWTVQLVGPRGIQGPTGAAAPDAGETVKGIAELATQAEANAGTDDARMVTPAKLAGRFQADIEMADAKLQRPYLQDYAEVLVGGTSGTNTGATATIDLESGNVHHRILDANCTFTFANPPASGRVGSFTLILRNDATPSRTTTWPAAVDWPAGTAPNRDTTANAVNIFSFVTYDAGTTWFGVLAGRGMA